MPNEETNVTEPKHTFEINDAKDEAVALNEQTKEVKETKEGDPQTDEPQKDDNNDSDPKDPGTEKKKKSRAQKRIEKLAAEKRELQKQLAEAHNTGNNESRDIDPDDYDDYDAYLDALDAQDKEPKPQAQSSDNSNFQQLIDDIDVKFDDAREKHEDFDDLVRKDVSDGGPAITQPMLEAMNEFDNAGEIAYALAKDTKESIRIAALKPMKQILEINKLSAKLSKDVKKKPEKKATNAPEPIDNVLGGGEAPINSLSEARNYSEYQKMRAKQSRGNDGW